MSRVCSLSIIQGLPEVTEVGRGQSLPLSSHCPSTGHAQMGSFGKLSGLLPNSLQRRPGILLPEGVSVEAVSRHQEEIENVLTGYAEYFQHRPQTKGQKESVP